MGEHHSAEEISKHVRSYMIVFGSLAVLTIVTVAVSYLHLSIWPALILALVIATFKGGLVASFFMHLKEERKIIYYVLVLTIPLLIIMFILFVWAYHGHDGTPLM